MRAWDTKEFKEQKTNKNKPVEKKSESWIDKEINQIDIIKKETQNQSWKHDKFDLVNKSPEFEGEENLAVTRESPKFE